MVIFNSYVKLPDGKNPEKKIYFQSLIYHLVAILVPYAEFSLCCCGGSRAAQQGASAACIFVAPAGSVKDSETTKADVLGICGQVQIH